MATKTKKPAGDKKPGPVEKLTREFPDRLADWLEGWGAVKATTQVEKDVLGICCSVLRSPKLRSNAKRHCCGTSRGLDVPHAEGCSVSTPVSAVN
jgi:hypothetical protein